MPKITYAESFMKIGEYKKITGVPLKKKPAKYEVKL